MTPAVEAAPILGDAALSAWRWKSRLLLVFAPSEANLQLAEQRNILALGQAGGRERDIVVIEIVGEKAADNLDAATLRSRYAAPRGAFAVILIGKDGGEKLRRTEPLDSEALFSVIDRMPMRRQEAAREAVPRTPRTWETGKSGGAIPQ